MTHHFILFIFYHQHVSGDRSVSVVSHYRWDSQVSIPNRGIDFPPTPPPTSRPPLGAIQTPIRFVSLILFPRLKQLEHDVSHSPPSTVMLRIYGLAWLMVFWVMNRAVSYVVTKVLRKPLPLSSGKIFPSARLYGLMTEKTIV
jgi:hypothetical protein